MSRVLFVMVAFFVSLNVFAQLEYTLEGFSDTYYGVFIMSEEQAKNVFKEGTILVFNKKTGKALLEVECDGVAFDGKVSPDSNTNQSLLIYEDFNFDGMNDLAIQENYSSKGPSYSIYLAKGETFVFDSVFSEIIQGSQGSWDLDPETKKIYTRGDGGCCWHSFSTYSIQDGRPVRIVEVINQIDFAYHITTTKVLKDGKIVETVEKRIDLQTEGITEIMSFDLLNKKKKVVLFNINDRTLNYVLISGDDKVEFNYPINTIYANPDFTLSNLGNDLVFKNENVEYKIYQIFTSGKISSVGVLVKVDGKTYDLKGDITSLIGSLKKIPKLDNVVIK